MLCTNFVLDHLSLILNFIMKLSNKIKKVKNNDF